MRMMIKMMASYIEDMMMRKKDIKNCANGISIAGVEGENLPNPECDEIMMAPTKLRTHPDIAMKIRLMKNIRTTFRCPYTRRPQDLSISGSP